MQYTNLAKISNSKGYTKYGRSSSPLDLTKYGPRKVYGSNAAFIRYPKKETSNSYHSGTDKDASAIGKSGDKSKWSWLKYDGVYYGLDKKTKGFAKYNKGSAKYSSRSKLKGDKSGLHSSYHGYTNYRKKESTFPSNRRTNVGALKSPLSKTKNSGYGFRNLKTNVKTSLPNIERSINIASDNLYSRKPYGVTRKGNRYSNVKNVNKERFKYAIGGSSGSRYTNKYKGNGKVSAGFNWKYKRIIEKVPLQNGNRVTIVI